MDFSQLNLSKPLLRAVEEEGYRTPTPIQEQAVPHVLAGSDLLGIAQTGTGKTAAFALPILHNLSAHPAQKKGIRALVVAPTRELATQIGDSFSTYGRHTRITNTVIFGGVGQNPQVRALRRGVDVLVATPGRLLDLMNQGHVSLAGIEILVLDEADRMLDMGFINDVKRILAKVPKQRQTLFFSATFAPEVSELSRSMLRNPRRVEVTPSFTTAEKVEQSIYFVRGADKRRLLVRLLQEDDTMQRVLVFTRTKRGADRLAQILEDEGFGAEAIHGNKMQRARERALANFKSGRTRLLVATDIAARGIDVEGITHVLNHDLPNIPESYVHRIGRTARAGAVGSAISFCDPGGEERTYLKDIERWIRATIPRVAEHAFHVAGGAAAPAGEKLQPNSRKGRQQTRQQQGRRPQQGQGQRQQQGQGQRQSQSNGQRQTQGQGQRQTQGQGQRQTQGQGLRQPSSNGQRQTQGQGQRQPQRQTQGNGQRQTQGQGQRSNPNAQAEQARGRGRGRGGPTGKGRSSSSAQPQQARRPGKGSRSEPTPTSSGANPTEGGRNTPEKPGRSAGTRSFGTLRRR